MRGLVFLVTFLSLVTIVTAQQPATTPAPAAGAVSKTATITWTYDAQDQDGHALSRKVGNGAYAELTRILKGTLTYQDTLAGAGTYCYTATPYNATGLGKASNEACVTIAVQAVPAGTTQITVIIQAQ